tara:strand:- start:80 stop:784 length:705 start_codon:yes stop_codon:yes gene_type:complete
MPQLDDIDIFAPSSGSSGGTKVELGSYGNFKPDSLKKYISDPEGFMSRDKVKQRFLKAKEEIDQLVIDGDISINELPRYQDLLYEQYEQGMPPRAQSYFAPYSQAEASYIADYMSYGRERSNPELFSEQMREQEESRRIYQSSEDKLSDKSGIVSLVEGLQRRTRTDYPSQGTTTFNIKSETDDRPALNFFRRDGGSGPPTFGLEVKRRFVGRRPKNTIASKTDAEREYEWLKK